MPYHKMSYHSLFDSDEMTLNNKTVILGFILSPLLCSYLTTMLISYMGKESNCGEYVSGIYMIHFVLTWLIEHFPWNLSWWVIQTASFVLMAGLSEYVFNRKPIHNAYIQLDHTLNLDDLLDHEL